MNLLEARVSLRPRAMSDVIDLAGPFCVANRRLFIPLTLLVAAGGGLLALACRSTLGWPWQGVWLALAGYLLLSNGIYTQAAADLMFRPPEEVRVVGVVGRFLRRLPPYLAARILTFLVLALSSIVLVPLPVFGARLLFSTEAVLLENAAPMVGLSRSSRLVLYRSGPCLGLATACLCAPFLFALAGDLVGQSVVDMVLQMGKPVGDLWNDGGSAYAVAGALLSAPFVASAGFLGYIDMRTRKEGWDIQLRFMALADGEGKERRVAS
jgi:hypothetical protein